MRLLAFLFVLFSFSASFAQAKEVVNKIITIVNEEIILKSDLEDMDKRVGRIGSVDDTLLLGEKIDSLKNNKKAQLEFLIREKLVDSEIKRQNMGISDEQVTAEMNSLAKKNQMSSSEFATYMKNEGYTLDQYKVVLKARMERQSFFERDIISKLRITDEDAYSVYRQNAPNYRPSVNEYRIAQIFFSSRKGGDESALSRARAASERLRNGESFETLANQLDETPGSNKDGVLGTFKSGEFAPAMERAVESISVGETSSIVESSTGYHLIKLLSKNTILDPNFVRVKEQIKAGLVQQNFERQLKNWFEIKKSQAYIQNLNDETPKTEKQ